MAKRLFALMTAIVLCLTFVPTQAWAEAPESRMDKLSSSRVEIGNRADAPVVAASSGYCGSNVSWYLDGGTLTISGQGDMYDYEYPDDVPYPQDQITRVVIESGVTSVGQFAFCNCYNLRSASIPGSVDVIASGSFMNCESLTEVSIANGVTEIGGFVFAGSALRSVHIPASVTEIWQGVFAYCNSLTSITVDSGNREYYSDGGVLFDRDGILHMFPAGYRGSYTVPDGISMLYHYSFDGCTGLTSVTLPASITEVGAGAFEECTGLSEVYFEGNAPTFYDGSEGDSVSASFEGVSATVYYPQNNSTWTSRVRQNYGGSLRWVAYNPLIPDNAVASGECGDEAVWYLTSDGKLTVTGSGAMYDYEYNEAPFPQDQIQYITIKSGITAIGDNAFANCKKLTGVSIPSTVGYIGWQAFCNCTSLSEATIPNGVVTISGYAFENCNLSSVYIPASTTEIWQGVFSTNKNLTAITVDSANPNYYSRNGILFTRDGGLLLLPGGYQGQYAVPNGTTHIYHYSFMNCAGLTSVTLPASTAEIGAGAFAGCSNLSEIYFTGNAPSFYDDSDEGVAPSFYGVTATVYYPENNSTWSSSVRQNYGGRLNWVAYNPNAGGSCGNNLEWRVSSGTLTIYGSGDMYDWTEGNQTPWYNTYRNEITAVVIESGVTSIGSRAFAGLTNVTRATIPSTVTSIGEEAFASCSSLSSVSIPDGVTAIRNGTFSGCTSLGALRVPDTVKYIGNYAFRGCTSLSGIALGNQVEKIYSEAFANCDHLVELTFPASVKEIGSVAFSGCTRLRQMKFLGNAPTIGTNAFKNVTATVYYPSGNGSWSGSVRQNYGGSLSWVTHDTGSQPSGAFTDVKPTDYFYEPVLWAVDRNITGGIGNGRFGPNQACTRGQIVTFLWAASGRPEPVSTSNPFSDVKSSDYFYKAVLWAVERGITSGVRPGKFGPNETCTRGQVATFLWASKGRPSPASAANTFSDVKASDYYYTAVLWAVENGITGGVGNGRFGPNQICTRGQIVTFLFKAFG